MKVLGLILALMLFGQSVLAQNGPYAPAANIAGTSAMHADSSAFIQWANQSVIERGWINIADTSLGLASVGDSNSCISNAGLYGVVSLGDGGSAVLQFDGVIYNGPGNDFAIFENSFSDDYLELATVEVSSDGLNFFAFPSSSLTQTDSQIGTFGLLDPTYLHNLAGKYRALYGTPFDLEELSGIEDLNINQITHVKIIDVVGAISGDFISIDSNGNYINDPFPTEFPSSGFDLDALGIIHWDIESKIDEWKSENINIFPNPFRNKLTIKNLASSQVVVVFNSYGQLIFKSITSEEGEFYINTDDWEKGMYIIHIENSKSYPVFKI